MRIQKIYLQVEYFLGEWQGMVRKVVSFYTSKCKVYGEMIELYKGRVYDPVVVLVVVW